MSEYGMKERSAGLGFVGGKQDRADHVRMNPQALQDAFGDRNARVVAMDRLSPVIDGDILLREHLPFASQITEYALLGLDADGPLFVWLNPDVPHGGQFDIRALDLIATLRADELALYGAARSLIDWHARHGFCAVCGSPTQPVKAGWSRQCGACRAEHFPRVDPVVIMLAEYDGRVLVGRGCGWPEGRFSALAGFLEPGESLEEAVARELKEEAGVTATTVRYTMSQPWPFPSSLMIGCIATVEDSALTLDTNELEAAIWVDAQEVRAALAGEDGAPFAAPPVHAVAHHLLRLWAEEQSD